jgi:hypothetical protein
MTRTEQDRTNIVAGIAEIGTVLGGLDLALSFLRFQRG